MAEILNFERTSFNKSSKGRQTRLRVHGMHGLKLSIQVRDYDVAVRGLVKNDPDGRRSDQWHIGSSGENTFAGGIVQSSIQATESGFAWDKIHNNPDSQRLERLN